MSLQKQYKLADKAAALQREVIEELEGITRSIERCEKTIVELASELDAVNREHQDRKTTQQDIDYLTALLNCAHKKLGWEKQIASLQKRIPALVQNVTTVMNDHEHPPGDDIRTQMTAAIERVQAAMQRLNAARIQ